MVGQLSPGELGNLKHYGDEPSPTRAQAFRIARNSFPELESFLIPRNVVERLDLGAGAKIIYGVLNTKKRNSNTTPRMTNAEIGGLTGLTTEEVTEGIEQLYEQGLIDFFEMATRYRGEGFPPQYKVKESTWSPPEELLPNFMDTDISNLEEKINEHFII